MEVLAVQLILHFAQCFAEALEVYDFSLAEEANDVVYIWVIGQAKNVVVGGAGFLFGAHVFHQVSDHIALHLHGSCGPGCTRCELGIYCCGVVNEISVKACLLDLIHCEISCQLVHDGAYHLEVTQFFYPHRSTANGAVYAKDGQKR